ncbi:MAG TPA: hypothetical protein VFK45_09000 [Gammaproteobacteria bacterium]|nr:hypothetical protein [Gammaproteobacteria bacterium]
MGLLDPGEESERNGYRHSRLALRSRGRPMKLGDPWAFIGRPLAAALLLGALCPLAGCSSKQAAQARAVYVSFPVANAVERISVADGQTLSRTVVGALPHVMVLSHDGTKLYVALTGSQAIAVLETKSGKLLRTILTEPVPRTRYDGSVIEAHVRENAFSATTCFACHNGKAGAAEPTVVGNRPFGLSLSPDGKTLLVTNINGGSLSVIDLVHHKLKRVVPLARAGAAWQPTAIARMADTVYLTVLPVLPSSKPAVVRRLDAASLKPRPEPDTQVGSEAYFLLPDPARNSIYLSNFETNTVTRLSPDGELLGKYIVGTGPRGLLMLPDGKQVVVADYYSNSPHRLSVIDLDSDKVAIVPLVLGKQTFANPTRLAVDPAGRFMFLLSGATNGFLLKLDTKTWKLATAFPVSGLPFDVVAVPPAISNVHTHQEGSP